MSLRKPWLTSPSNPMILPTAPDRWGEPCNSSCCRRWPRRSSRERSKRDRLCGSSTARLKGWPSAPSKQRRARGRAMRALACLVLGACILGARDNTVARAEAQDGWLLLFDGESLFGWSQDGKKWHAGDGVLSCDA